MSCFENTIKSALVKFSRFDVTKSEVSKTVKIYSTPIENKEGTITRRMDVKIDNEYSIIDVKVCVKSGIKDKCNMDKLYKKLNDLEKQYLYVRIYVNGSGDLIADYRTEIELFDITKSIQVFGERNIIELITVVASVMMQYTNEIEEFLKYDGTGSTEESQSVFITNNIILNPFDVRGKAV